MSIVESVLSTARQDYFRRLSEQAKLTEKIEKRDTYLATPEKVDVQVAKLAAKHLPPKKAVEKLTTSVLDPITSIEEGFAKDDPMRSLARDVRANLENPDIVNQYGPRISGPQVVEDVYKRTLVDYLNTGKPYEYKRKAETAIPFFKKDTGELPGYEQWRATEGADKPREWANFRKGLTPEGIKEYMQFGAGTTLALAGVEKLGWRGISKLAGTILEETPALGPWGIVSKIAGAALIAIPEFLAFDAARDVVKDSGWAQARQDEPLKTEIASFALGAAVPFGATTVARRLRKGYKDVAAYNAERLQHAMDVTKEWTQAGYGGEGNTALSILNKQLVESKLINKTQEVADLEVGFNRLLKKDKAGFDSVLAKFEEQVAKPKNLIDEALGVTKQFGPEALDRSFRNIVSKTTGIVDSDIDMMLQLNVDVLGDIQAAESLGGKITTAVKQSAESRLANTYNKALSSLDEKGVEQTADLMAEGLGRKEAAIKAYRSQLDEGRLSLLTADEVRGEAKTVLDKVTKDYKLGNALQARLMASDVKETLSVPKPKYTPNWRDMPVTNEAEFRRYTKAAAIEMERKTNIAKARLGHKQITKDQYNTMKGNYYNEFWNDVLSVDKELEAQYAAARLPLPDKSTIEAQLKDLFPERWATTSEKAKRNINIIDEEIAKSFEGKVVTEAMGAQVMNDQMAKGDSKAAAETFRTLWRGTKATRPSAKAQQAREALKAEKDLIKKGAMAGKELPDVKFANESENVMSTAEDIDSFINTITQNKKYIAALTLIPATALLGIDTKESEAAALPVEAAKVSALAAREFVDYYKYGARSQEQLMKDMIKRGYVSIFGTNKYLPKQYMNGVSQMALKDHWKLGHSDMIKNFNGVNHFLTNLMTKPAIGGLIYHKWFNPWVEMASRITAAFENTSMDKLAVSNILGDVKGLNSGSHKIIADTMKPVADKYYQSAVEADIAKRMVTQIEEDLNPLLAKQTAGKLKEGDIDLINNLKKAMTKNQEIYDVKHKEFLTLGKGWENTAKSLAQKFAETRIFLALDDTAEFAKYPWLKPMLTRGENAAVSRFRDLLGKKGAMIEQAGEDVIAGPYVHYAAHPAVDFSKLQNQYRNYMTGELETVKFAHFHSRSLGAKPMMPDIVYSMEKYFPDANRRIQVSDFWKSGWRDHMHWAMQQTDGLKNFWNDFNGAFKPVADTPWNRRFRTYYALETARLLFASPSVAWKHMLKQTGNVAMFGLGPIVRNSHKAFQSEMTARLSSKLYRDVSLDTGKSLTAYERSSFIKALSNQGSFNNVVNDLDLGDIPVGRLSNALAKWNEKGAVMVDLVEKFDRGNSIFMALEMAGKKGMTPEQAAYSVYDTIIRANFLSGVTNPTWLRDPKMRAFLMFQGTPFKLMEQRVLRAISGVKAISNSAKKLWKQADALQELKAEMKGTENAFKANLIMDSLNLDTDIFGTNIGKQFMTNVLVLGGVAFTGLQTTDSNLWPQLFHPPFIKPGPEQIGIGLSPIVQAAWSASHKKADDNWFFNYAARQYFAAGKNVGPQDLLPVNFKKAIRLMREDNPKLYGDDNWTFFRYLFAIPAKGKGHLQ